MGALVTVSAASAALMRALEPSYGSGESVVNPELGRRLLQLNKRSVDAPLTYRTAIEADFEGLDRSFYDGVSIELTGTGFRLLGDVVNSRIDQSEHTRAVTRVFGSSDGRIVFDAAHIVFERPSKLHPSGEARLYSASCEFEDGSSLIVNNSKASALQQAPPAVEKIVLLPSATALDVWKTFEGILSSRAKQGGPRIESLDDAIAFFQRQHASAVEFRRKIGYIDPLSVRKQALFYGNSQDVAEALAKSADDARRLELAMRRGSHRRS